MAQTVHCINCDSKYPKARAELGFDTCLDCGEQQATKEIARRKKCVAPAYNKGGYQYVATREQALFIGK